MYVVLSKVLIWTWWQNTRKEVSPTKFGGGLQKKHTDNVTRVFALEEQQGLEVFDNISFHVRWQREYRSRCEVDA